MGRWRLRTGRRRAPVFQADTYRINTYAARDATHPTVPGTSDWHAWRRADERLERSETRHVPLASDSLGASRFLAWSNGAWAKGGTRARGGMIEDVR